MTPEQERAYKRHFQKIKSMSFESFKREMNIMHTRAYAACQRHYRDAMYIVLQPKQAKAVEDKAKEIREQWEGMATVTPDKTKTEEFEG